MKLKTHITQWGLPKTIYVQNLWFPVTHFFLFFEILIFQTFALEPFFDHFCQKYFV